MKLSWFLVQLRDILELFLIPCIALFLPWRLCFRFFKIVCRLGFLYKAQAAGVVDNFKSFNLGGAEEENFVYHRRLVTLVDHADMFLVWSRGRSWIKKNIQINGQWPAPDNASVLCTFHWGAGMWSLRDTRLSGLKAHALVASLKKENFVGRPVLHFYAKLRTKTIAREIGCETIDATVTLRAVLKALKSNEQIMAVVDVPADAVAASTEVHLLGAVAKVPKGLLRVAADNKLPVTVFTVGISMETGQRYMNIKTLAVEEDADVLIAEVFSYLDDAIKGQPSAWHFWGEANRFFVGMNAQK